MGNKSIYNSQKVNDLFFEIQNQGEIMKINVQHGTDEWLEWRAEGIGASDFPVLVMREKHPYSTPYKLWKHKKGIEVVEANYAMQMGTNAEEGLRHWFNREHNKSMKPECQQHDTFPYIRASLDGIDGDEILEIKWTNEKYHLLAKKGSIPEAYRLQIQHQLFVSGASKAYYLSHNAALGDTVVLEELPDEETLNQVQELCSQFYTKMQEDSFEDLTHKDQIEAPEEMEDLFYEYGISLNNLDLAKKKVEFLKNKIIKTAPHTNLKGFGYSVQRIPGRTTTAYSKIPLLKEVDLSEYQKTSEPYWIIKKND